MSVYKNEKTGKWYAIFRYTDWQGNRKQKKKEGFKTKREAQEYEREFLLKETSKPDMLFSSLVDLYMDDIKTRVRVTTFENKRNVIYNRVLPFFAKRKINEITASDVRRWQNALIKEGYAQTYIKTIHNQLSAIFNYACRYHNLEKNPARDAGAVGKKKADRVSFWTSDEFNKAMTFLDETDYITRISFEVLFWTGMRIGELFALTQKDIDFDKRTISITKTYAKLQTGERVINKPKTDKSEREIEIPQFLCDDIKAFIARYDGGLK